MKSKETLAGEHKDDINKAVHETSDSLDTHKSDKNVSKPEETLIDSSSSMNEKKTVVPGDSCAGLSCHAAEMAEEESNAKLVAQLRALNQKHATARDDDFITNTESRLSVDRELQMRCNLCGIYYEEQDYQDRNIEVDQRK